MMFDDDAIEPAWLTINDARRYIGCGRTSLYLAINRGFLDARTAFGRTLIRRSSIDEYLKTAPAVGSLRYARSEAEITDGR